MTLEQFLGGVLGLGLIAIARLVDRWLPPTESHPQVVTPQVSGYLEQVPPDDSVDDPPT